MKKKFRTAEKILPIIIFSAFVTFFTQQILAAQNASEPHLVFKKSVVVKKYKDGQVYTEPHIVKKGEHLWKILREHYSLSNPKIAFYCKIAGAVNPEIKDIDKIYTNQNLLIPYHYIKDIKAKHGSGAVPAADVEHVVREGEHLAKLLRDNYNLPENVIFSRRTYRLIKEANPEIEDINELYQGQKIIIPGEILALQDYLLPEEKIAKASVNETVTTDVSSQEEARVKDMISSFTCAFDGTDNRTGRDVLPIKGRGSVTLDYSKFPVYEFPWGKKILFDYGSRLPSGIKEVITSEWENAEVVAVKEKDDMESILGKVLDVCGFFKVEKDGEYIVNRDNIQISISGNWIVFKDNMLKNIFVVTLVENEEETISPELNSYFSSMGLNIVDVTSGKAGQEKKKPGYDKKIEYQKIQAEPIILTDLILDILGQKYYKDHSTKIFQNIHSGFSLEVMADRMFEKDGAKYMIDFHSLPGKICEIISDQGFHMLQIDPQGDEFTSVVKEVLDFCGATYGSSPAEFQYDRGKKSNIKLKIPGFLIETGSGDVLLTQVGLSEPILQFLTEMDVKIIQF
jgi:hypothetical protein